MSGEDFQEEGVLAAVKPLKAVELIESVTKDVVPAGRNSMSSSPMENQSPLEILFRQHSDRVFRTAHRVTGSAADAEDVLQTVFLRLARGPESPSVLENPEGDFARGQDCGKRLGVICKSIRSDCENHSRKGAKKTLFGIILGEVMKNKEVENILDKVAAGIRSEQVDTSAANEATERVWARLSVEADTRTMQAHHPPDHPSAAAAPGTPVYASAPADTIEGCADFQSLIPPFLGGKVSGGGSHLLVDHTHEGIPCRRGLKQARESRVAAPTPARKQARKTFNYSLNPGVVRWGIAAGLVVGLVLFALLVMRHAC